MDESVKFLSKIYDLLVEGNVLETRSNERKSIVNFQHPTDLKVRNRNLAKRLFEKNFSTVENHSKYRVKINSFIYLEPDKLLTKQ